MSRKPRLAKRVRYALMVGVINFLIWFVPRFRLETLQGAGDLLGAIGARLPGKRRRRVIDHLNLAYPAGGINRSQVLKETYQSAIKTFFEVLWGVGWNPAADNKRLTVADPAALAALLEETKRRGRGLVIFTAHLGCSELTAHWFVTSFGLPCMAVAARPKIKALEGAMERVRGASGLRQIYRGEAGTATLRHLRAGGVLILMVDHNLKGPGVEVPFFGHGAHTILAPARLALQAGAVVTTMFGLRNGPGEILLENEPPMAVPEAARDKALRFQQEVDLTRAYTARIEEMVRRYPGQYLWMHKRWQKRPGTLPLPS
ncbi:lysophospholipid acyltransferase family protein [Candidatus Sumerlaeota bacterium]|nr:lysophospholipid acyltransferase family protein [Candidatus Sumerlaeota bacterium]